MHSCMWEDDEYARVAIEDVLELLTEKERIMVLAVNMPEVPSLQDSAVNVLDGLGANDAIPLADDGLVKKCPLRELVDDADADVPSKGDTTRPIESHSEIEVAYKNNDRSTCKSIPHVDIQDSEGLNTTVPPIADSETKAQDGDILHDAPAALILQRSPPPVAVPLRDNDPPDPLPANNSLALLLLDESVNNLLETKVGGFLEDSVEDSEDTKNDIQCEVVNSEKTRPHTTETASMPRDLQGMLDNEHSTSENDLVALLLSATEQDSLLIHITPPTTPSSIHRAFPPRLHIISPSPPACHPSTPAPSPYGVRTFLASVSSSTPSPSTSCSLSCCSSSAKLRYDPGNPNDTLDMDTLLHQCDGYDSLLDTVENWPTEPDAPDDWENTPGSLTKLEEMRARRAEVLKAREQQKEAAKREGEPHRKESSFAWDERYESLLDIVEEGLDVHEDAEEGEVYGTLGMHAFLAMKKKSFWWDRREHAVHSSTSYTAAGMSTAPAPAFALAGISAVE